MMVIATLTPSDIAVWAGMRHALWPEASTAEHATEAEEFLAQQDVVAFLVWLDEKAIGFAEAAVRTDYVNGCHTSPVVFLDGIYVEPLARRRGLAAALVEAVQAWGVARGYSEMASDTAIDNLQSQQMHRALGFEETERVVYFRKPLPPS